MTVKEAVIDGWEYASKHTMGAIGSLEGADYSGYISDIVTAADTIVEHINAYAGDATPVDKLQGFIAEELHADTFNLQAVIRGSASRAIRGDSNKHGSADTIITLADGSTIEYSLKYYATGSKSAVAQAKNVIERYHEYRSQPRQGEPMSFEQYLAKNGYTDADVYTTIYNGQGRLIPSDQLDEAIAFLKRKIAEDSLSDKPSRIAVMQGRLETLQRLSDRMKDGEGVESMPLTREEAQAIAELAKEGEFELKDIGIDINQITRDLIVEKALKAGCTAAVISLVLQLVPEIFKAIDHLQKNGELDIEELKKSGLKCLSATATGFLRGSIACGLTLACQQGLLGEALKKVPAPIIGAITVILIDTAINSLKVATGRMTAKEMGAFFAKEVIVSAAALGGGMVGQILLSQLPGLGYFIGSFIGSTLAGITLELGERLLISFCVDSGYTCFGLVEQDYTIPDQVLEEMGIDLIRIPEIELPEVDIAEVQLDTIEIDTIEPETIELTVLRRGIIGVKKVGYTIA